MRAAQGDRTAPAAWTRRWTAFARASGLGAGVLAAALAGCGGETGTLEVQAVESCMVCHNGSLDENYGGPGLENPHPFPGAAALACTTCHGGNGQEVDQLASHVPPPPEIGDDAFQTTNARAYFNRRTLAGIDQFGSYTVGGRSYTALDYLQFINPGDLRVVSTGKSCGQCHTGHAQCVNGSLLASEAGILSGARFAIGETNAIPESVGLHHDTAADYGFRAVMDVGFQIAFASVGAVSRLAQYPVHSVFGNAAGIHNNPAFDEDELDDDFNADGSVAHDSPLAKLFHEQVAFTCGDCHLGSAGANNRAGDFRSSGCTACHMAYSLGGRSGSQDPNVNKLEPANPDAIQAPERSHVATHRIASVSRTLANGVSVAGIDDHACAGCHQGSNRTVMQYWGIRLDQNADVVNDRQYPANPVSRLRTTGDVRLFDPAVGNNTFNGRNHNQYLLEEDYDGDGRDDTPEDVHYQAGLGCIDCHGSFDLHGGDVTQPATDEIHSRMEQQVAIQCESCHGTIDAYAQTVAGTLYDGSAANVLVDSKGNRMRHVWRAPDGTTWLRSRLDGALHFVPQTRDTVVDTGKTNPLTTQPVYSAHASYAMGRFSSTAPVGLGPIQTAGTPEGFSHTDRMDCASCHASWTNTCMGCHLEGEYNTGNNFSNVTGQRIVYKERNADFTYQSPLFFQLGVNARGKITQFSANTKTFYQWYDRTGSPSEVYHFTDRNGGGSNPARAFPSMSHNAMMAHSIRGKVDAEREGPRYCASCHLTDSGLATWGAQYDAFRNALATGDFGALDFNLLRTHFGLNTGNQLGSPFFAHMAAGLGTGLFLFSDQGAPTNPLDTFAGRKGAFGVAPSVAWNPANVALNLDRIVEPDGEANGSNNHTWLDPLHGPALRTGATDPSMAGPLGSDLIQMLCDPVNGLVLDSWLDANGNPQGDAAAHIP